MITAWYFSLGHPNRDVNIGWLKDETERKQPQTIPCKMLLKNSQIDVLTVSSLLLKELLTKFQLFENHPLFGSSYLKFSNVRFMFKVCGSCLASLDFG